MGQSSSTGSVLHVHIRVIAEDHAQNQAAFVLGDAEMAESHEHSLHAACAVPLVHVHLARRQDVEDGVHVGVGQGPVEGLLWVGHGRGVPGPGGDRGGLQPDRTAVPDQHQHR